MKCPGGPGRALSAEYTEAVHRAPRHPVRATALSRFGFLEHFLNIFFGDGSQLRSLAHLGLQDRLCQCGWSFVAGGILALVERLKISHGVMRSPSQLYIGGLGVLYAPTLTKVVQSRVV